MGWKNVKEHYRIGHFVHIRDGLICIGSPYISDIIAIRMDGTIVKENAYQNADLRRYLEEMRADPAKLRELIETPDSFTTSIPVYTEEDGEIVEKFCEQLGYPNSTHCGQFMYNNTHFADRRAAVAYAIENNEAGIRLLRRRAVEIRRDFKAKIEWLRKDKANLEHFKAELAALDAKEPS